MAFTATPCRRHNSRLRSRPPSSATTVGESTRSGSSCCLASWWGLNVVCRAFAAEGDEILSATPIYPPFLSAPEHACASRSLLDYLRANRDLVESMLGAAPGLRVFHTEATYLA